MFLTFHGIRKYLVFISNVESISLVLNVTLRGFCLFFFFQAEDGIRDDLVTGVQTCALPISPEPTLGRRHGARWPVRVGLRVLFQGYLPRPAQLRPEIFSE